MQPVTGEFDTVVDVFDEVVRRHGDRVALIVDGQELTFAGLAARADAFAEFLITTVGIAKGDVVAIQVQDQLDFAIAYHGVIRTGAVASVLDPCQGADAVRQAAERCPPRHVVDNVISDLGEGDPLRRRVALDRHDPVAVVWTADPVPRGVWFDHASLKAQVRSAAATSVAGDRRLCAAPLWGAQAVTGVWESLTNLITTIVVPAPGVPAEFGRLLNDAAATAVYATTRQYQQLLATDPPPSDRDGSLRVAVVTDGPPGAPLCADLHRVLGAGTVVTDYSTVTAPAATCTRANDSTETTAATVGRCRAGVELRLVDELGTDLTGRGPDFVGEICLRSRSTARGYWNEADQPLLDDDGWLHSGDLGWIGRDGNLRLLGRLEEMYIRGGNDVYPSEVERCLQGFRKLAEAALIGVPVSDRLGEIGVLCAVAVPGATLKLGDLRAYVHKHLAAYKAPDCLLVLAELPRTETGQVDRTALVGLARPVADAWKR